MVGVPETQGSSQFKACLPIMFDTQWRSPMTSWENYGEMWSCLVNTIPFSYQKHILGHHHSDHMTMTGMCLEGYMTLNPKSKWKVHCLAIHSRKPPDNKFVLNPWLWTCDQNKTSQYWEKGDSGPMECLQHQMLPIGIMGNVWPTEYTTEATDCGEESGFHNWSLLLWYNWHHPTNYMTQSRQKEIFTRLPVFDPEYARPCVLSEVVYKLCNKTNQPKCIRFNHMMPMCHMCTFPSWYMNKGRVMIEGKLTPSNTPHVPSYFIMMAYAEQPTPMFPPMTQPQDTWHGLGNQYLVPVDISNTSKGLCSMKDAQWGHLQQRMAEVQPGVQTTPLVPINLKCFIDTIRADGDDSVPKILLQMGEDYMGKVPDVGVTSDYRDIARHTFRDDKYSHMLDDLSNSGSLFRVSQTIAPSVQGEEEFQKAQEAVDDDEDPPNPCPDKGKGKEMSKDPAPKGEDAPPQHDRRGVDVDLLQPDYTLLRADLCMQIWFKNVREGHVVGM